MKHKLTPLKARMILHEGKAHGKNITEKQRRFFGARASGYPVKIYGEGGLIIDAYRKGTAEQLWNVWNEPQRIHFIMDHTGNQHTPASQIEISKKAYNFLPADIKKQLAIHHATGFYHDGGRAGMKVGGRGFFGLQKGEKIKSNKELSIGDIVLKHSNQFNADNTLKIIGKRKYGNHVALDSIYWNPKTNQRIGNEDLGVDVTFGDDEYYKPVTMKTPYQTPDKKKLLAKIKALQEQVKKTTSPEILSAINSHIEEAEKKYKEKKSLRERIKAK